MAEIMDANTFSNENNIKKIKHQEQKQEPYKATQLWQKLISHLKKNVACKRRRYRIKQYDDCFTGENAVDVIYECLLRERQTCTLITNEITRSVAVKVCQALLDNSVIEVVGGKPNTANSSNHCLFEDSVSKLYKIIDQQMYEPQSKHSEQTILKVCDTKINQNLPELLIKSFNNPSISLNTSLENAKSWFECISPFQRSLRHSLTRSPNVTSDSLNFGSSPVLEEKCLSNAIVGVEQEHTLSFTGKRKLRSSTRTKSDVFPAATLKSLVSEIKENHCDNGNVETTCQRYRNKNGKPNLLKFQKRLSSSNTNLAQSGCQDDDTSQSFNEDKVWREVALARLLALLDLSFIEDILPSPKKALKKPDYQSVITNSTILKKIDLSSKNENLWVQFAQEITESCCFFFDNPIGLSENQLKMQAFDKICRYYSSLPSPIIPENLSKVFIAILGLIKAERYSVGVHALQLAVLLLPWQERREFRNLFKFMKLATDDTTVRLNPKLTNHQYVLQQFSPVVLHYEMLGKDQAIILNSFILHHHTIILVPPPEIKKEVEKICMESRFRNVLPHSAIHYCNLVSCDAYEQESKLTSQKALEELMNYIMDSVDITLKDKERWVKKFKKCHHGVYVSVFKNTT